MPSTNVTIDDVSALIQYTPLGDAWKDSPTSDSGLGSYFDGTYHSTNVYGSAATFQFDGTAVYIYAAKRFQHGPYVIHLDGQPVYNGTFQSSTSIYKQLMYSVTGLTPGTHTLKCTNDDPTNQTYTEVDFITWTTSMDSALAETYGSSIAVSNMNYSSMAAWQQSTDSEPTMVTATDGASVTINFQGNGIQLEGKTGSIFGAFSAQVDDSPARQLNAQSSQTHSSLLFRQDNLASGNHTLVVTNRGGGFTSLAIGSATPIIWSNGPPPSSPPSSSSSSSPNAGVIAGAVVAAVVGLAALVLALFWFLRRRRQAQHSKGEDVVRPTNEPAFIDATPFVLPPAQTASSVRGSKIGDDPMQSGMSLYRAVPGSPGMSSRGSFDYGPGGMGMAGSSSAGTSAGWAAAGAGVAGSGWARGGKDRMHSGPTARHEIDEASMRDRDAGPVLLPQLPPAYSSATAGAMSDPAPVSGPSPVPTVPTPVPETVQGGGVFQPHGGSPVLAPSPSPRPGPGPA